MKVFVTALLIIGFIGMGNLSFAKDKTVDQNTTSENLQAKVDTAENNDFTGLVNKTEDGYTLLAGATVYLLIGETLEGFVGQKVHISGKLLDAINGKTILVAKTELVE